jgi:mono/diheme cytochrome c family protein
MRHQISWAVTVLSLAGGSAGAAEIPLPPGAPSSETVAGGRELFTMNFARPATERYAGGLGRNGNGVGPLFNETSCAACHSQGGAGGAGDLAHNVQLAGIVTEPLPRGTVPQILAQARKVHPAFDDDSPIVFVQRFSTGDRETVEAYDKWRDELLASFDGPENPILPRRRQQNGVVIELVERNTPALWGMGEIEKLRASGGDAIRRRLADEITSRKPWITGRPPVTADGEDGWYGWRGQVASLDRIVRGACASEMGIQVAGAPEAVSPVALKRRPGRGAMRESNAVDLTEEQVVSLTSFVSDLPRPVRRVSSSMTDRAHAGERLFNEIGCADCHVPDLGSVKGMYSDQLLHDMGEATRDVQAVAPMVRENVPVRVPVSRPVGGYGASASLTTIVNTSVVIPTRRSMEWKTPPLWGVRDSYPYFHDGRAATLRDAIEMHGGESERSAAEFRGLNGDQQQAVMTFLESLAAPPAEGDVALR